MVWYLYLSEPPVSHLDTLWREMSNASARSPCDQFFCVRRRTMFSPSVINGGSPLQIFCVQFSKRSSKSPPSGVEKLATSGCVLSKGLRNSHLMQSYRFLIVPAPLFFLSFFMQGCHCIYTSTFTSKLRSPDHSSKNSISKGKLKSSFSSPFFPFSCWTMMSCTPSRSTTLRFGSP